MREFFRPDEPTRDASAIAFTPDGQTLVVGACPRLLAYDVPSGNLLWTADVGDEVLRLDMDPDGFMVAVSCGGERSGLYFVREGFADIFTEDILRDTEAFEPGECLFTACVTGTNGDAVAVITDGQFYLQPTGRVTGRPPREIGWPAGQCVSVDTAQGGTLLAVARIVAPPPTDLGPNVEVDFWRPDGLPPPNPLFWPELADNALLALSGDGRYLALATSFSGEPGVLQLWEVANNVRWLRDLPADGVSVTGLAFSPDGRHLAASALDGSVFVFDTPAGTLRTRYHWGLPTMTSVTWAADGLTMAAGGTGAGGRVVVWDVEV